MMDLMRLDELRRTTTTTSERDCPGCCYYCHFHHQNHSPSPSAYPSTDTMPERRQQGVMNNKLSTRQVSYYNQPTLIESYFSCHILGPLKVFPSREPGKRLAIFFTIILKPLEKGPTNTVSVPGRVSQCLSFPQVVTTTPRPIPSQPQQP